MRKTLLIAASIIMLISVSVRSAAADYEIPLEIQEAAEKYADEYEISPEILLAIMRYESCYVPTVQNGNCKGLMQVNAKVHKDRIERLGITDIYDIDSNIHAGADLIAEFYKEYGDYGIALGLYHGEKYAIRNGRSGNYSSYTQKILKKSAELEEQKVTDGTEEGSM